MPNHRDSIHCHIFPGIHHLGVALHPRPKHPHQKDKVARVLDCKVRWRMVQRHVTSAANPVRQKTIRSVGQAAVVGTVVVLVIVTVVVVRAVVVG